MYLFNELQILPLILLLVLWGVSGWLMTLRWFDLESHERGLVGLGVGLIVANWLGNFLARFLPMSIAFWAAASLTLVLGLFAARPLNREIVPEWRKIRWWTWLLFISAAFIFILIGRGLGMLDDFQNLPTISVMATGDIPPHVAGSPDQRYGYHYFLILVGVQFMRVASAAPWTALDLARGLTLALAIFLVGFLAWRLTRNRMVAWVSAVFFAFAGGTRWLLLLLPGTLLNKVSSSLTLIGSGQDSGATLVDALSQPWEVAGSGPIPFPFAFVNGVSAPAVMAHHGYGVSAPLILLLILLLAGQQQTWKAGIPLTILFASLALANEVDFALLYLGIVLVAVVWMVQNKTVRPPQSARFWIVVVTLAGVFTLIQGGMATEVLRGRLDPSAAQADSYFKVDFSLVPPTVISSHLGKLSLLDPFQLLAALFEVGPLVLALPLALLWGYKALREEKWVQAALVASAIPSLLSVFIEYSGNAGITATTRLLSNLFLVCKIFAVPLFWSWLQNQNEWKHHVVYGIGIATILAGFVLFAIQLIAIPRPAYTEFLTDMDARFYEKYWNRLSPPSAWILDPSISRAPTVFGRQADSLVNWGASKPEYNELVHNPDPYRLNAAGYSYVYADKEYWKQYSAQLDQPCVKVLETVEGVKQTRVGSTPDFRRLADISQCK
ncbi:MAG TPA: hypothetical protein VFQ13_00135 [Anaerolineales bacterium]|nr:hypothetical protein [Anaerolineales bacterium]